MEVIWSVPTSSMITNRMLGGSSVTGGGGGGFGEFDEPPEPELQAASVVASASRALARRMACFMCSPPFLLRLTAFGDPAEARDPRDSVPPARQAAGGFLPAGPRHAGS